MKKLALVLALALPLAARPEPAMLPSHTVLNLLQGQADLFKMQVNALAWQATTTTWVNALRTAILTSDSGTESAPTAATVGLSLEGVKGVVVILKTSAAATAGGTLQAYLLNAETLTWARAPDLDLTAIASTNQTWPALWVAVSRGRLFYNPVGIGSVTTTIYLTGQRG